MLTPEGRHIQAIRVLLVEDDPRDAALEIRALIQRGSRFDVTTVRTLSDALATLNAGSFDVILLDIMLPDSRGFPTIAAIRKAAPIMIRDITDRKRTEAELRLMATTDPLTGLANRRHLLERAERELLRLQRFGKPFTLMTLDIDHFKRINDTYGHASGDRALCGLSATCIGLLREIDMVGRMGGEEFTIILPETVADEAMLVADRIRRGMAELRFDTDPPGSEFGFTVSLGVAECHRDDTRIEQPLARADMALYQAKAAGRNRVVRAPAPIPVPA
jgi:diguanylate cyclase (GGDEF)-like protein